MENNKIKFALHLAKDCTYSDAVTEGAKKHLRDIIDEALIELNANSLSPNGIGTPHVYEQENNTTSTYCKHCGKSRLTHGSDNLL